MIFEYKKEADVDRIERRIERALKRTAMRYVGSKLSIDQMAAAAYSDFVRIITHAEHLGWVTVCESHQRTPATTTIH